MGVSAHCRHCGHKFAGQEQFCTQCGVERAVISGGRVQDPKGKKYRILPRAVCSNCGILPGLRDYHCANCGGELPPSEPDMRPFCPKCDTPLTNGEKFCPTDGTPVTTPKES